MERALVWVLIIALVLVGAIEARAKFGYDQTLPAVEEAVLGNHPKLDELGESIHFWPSRIREERAGRPVVVLKWFSFVHDYRIALSVDSIENDNPVVMHVSTAGEPDSILAEPLGPASDEDRELTAGGMPMMPGGGGPPPMRAAGGPAGPGGPGGREAAGPGSGANGAGGARQFPTFEERDADGDGKLAGDELSERMQERLAEIDTNQDGAIDKDEFEAMRARRQRPGGAPGAAAPDGAERERPAEAPDADRAPADDTAPADAKPEA